MTIQARRKEALTHFTKTIAHPHLEDVLYKLALNFLENKDDMREEYLNTLKRIFVATKDYSERTNTEVGYIQFTLLRTNLIYGKLVYDVHIYDKRWYLEDYTDIGEIDMSYYFQPLEDAKQHLYKESRKYVGKVDPPRVDNIISGYLEHFGYFFVKMFRYVLLEATECTEYAEIVKYKNFRILAGELYDLPAVLHIEAKHRLSFDKLKEHISDKTNCKYLDLKNSNFTAMDMSKADLQYSDFRGSTLQEADFSKSSLEGCIFANCNLAQANFSGAKLSEANFQNANLQKANLSATLSVEGIFKNESRDAYCRLPMNLNGTDLREAIIENATLHKVDFSCANVEGAIFTNTDLTGCKFAKEQLLHIDLSDEQRSEIITL